MNTYTSLYVVLGHASEQIMIWSDGIADVDRVGTL
jgi:hypothetical protein